MPSGDVHLRNWKVGWIGAVPLSVGIAASTSPLLGVGALLGYALGYWIDPDLDQVGISSAEGRMMRSFGIFGAVMSAYWMLYGYMFRRKHRSFITHFPGVGTFIRVWYLFLPVIWVYYLFTKSVPIWVWTAMLGVFIGQTVADSIHTLADLLVGEPLVIRGKRSRGNGRFRKRLSRRTR